MNTNSLREKIQDLYMRAWRQGAMAKSENSHEDWSEQQILDGFLALITQHTQEAVYRFDYYKDPEKTHDVPCDVCGSKEWTDWLLLPHELFNRVGGYICFECFLKSHPIVHEVIKHVIGDPTPKDEKAGKSATHRRWSRNAHRKEQLDRLKALTQTKEVSDE